MCVRCAQFPGLSFSFMLGRDCQLCQESVDETGFTERLSNYLRRWEMSTWNTVWGLLEPCRTSGPVGSVLLAKPQTANLAVADTRCPRYDRPSGGTYSLNHSIRSTQIRDQAMQLHRKSKKLRMLSLLLQIANMARMGEKKSWRKAKWANPEARLILHWAT